MNSTASGFQEHTHAYGSFGSPGICSTSLSGPLVSTTFVDPQIGKLQINRAVCGKGGSGNDVTQRLQRMIQDNTLNVLVTNINMGGDPNKGADKTLKVDYTYRGQRLQAVVKEGDRLKLP